MSRSEFSAVIVHLISKCLWTDGSGRAEFELASNFPAVLWLVKAKWNETQIGEIHLFSPKKSEIKKI